MSTDPMLSAYSGAVGINNAGQVIGNYLSTSDSEGFITWTHSFITGPNGVGTTELGFYATGINDRGTVVGWDLPADPISTVYPAVAIERNVGIANEFTGLLGPTDNYDMFVSGS